MSAVWPSRRQVQELFETEDRVRGHDLNLILSANSEAAFVDCCRLSVKISRNAVFDASRSKMNDTQIRVPRIQGLPKQTLGRSKFFQVANSPSPPAYRVYRNTPLRIPREDRRVHWRVAYRHHRKQRGSCFQACAFDVRNPNDRHVAARFIEN